MKLDERIIDIFPDEAPANPSENLKKLTVHHVLCMGCGMDEMPRPTENWIRDFLAIPVNHEPGTTYMYNSTGSTLLGAIVRKKTGLGLHDYLKPRLFDKIGIDADNLRWFRMPDGMEIGGGGLLATTEDNLRLMKLYADGGVWEGERILAEDYVKLATTLQNESATEEKVNPPAKDNFVGYGYQIWMCRPKGVYRADGAMGQFTIVVPNLDMIIAITENANGMTGGEGPQHTLDVMWEFLDEIPADSGAVSGDTADCEALTRRLGLLALKKPPYAPYCAMRDAINGKEYEITDGYLNLTYAGVSFMSGEKPPESMTSFSFNFIGCICNLKFVQEGKNSVLTIALDGGRAEGYLGSGSVKRVLASGAWIEPNVFDLRLRWIETCHEYVYRFSFKDDAVEIALDAGRMPFGRNAAPVVAKLK